MPLKHIRQRFELVTQFVFAVVIEYTRLRIAGFTHAGILLVYVFVLQLKHTKTKRIFYVYRRIFLVNSISYEFVDGH